MAVTIIYISGGLGLLTVDWKMSHLLTTVPHGMCSMGISATVSYIPDRFSFM